MTGMIVSLEMGTPILLAFVFLVRNVMTSFPSINDHKEESVGKIWHRPSGSACNVATVIQLGVEHAMLSLTVHV